MMDYDDLKYAIENYLQNSNAVFTSFIDTFIGLAEERIFRSVIVPALRKQYTVATTADNHLYAKPSDYLAMSEFDVVSGGSHSYLLPKDVSFIREAYPAAATTGLPLYYAENDDTNFILGPTPDAAYAVDMNYYYDPPSIVSTSTSWLGNNAESALLYGCLSEAYRYLKGDADLQAEYERRYLGAMEDLAKLGLVMKKRDSYRDGDMRMAG